MASGPSGAGTPTHYSVSHLKSRFLNLAQTSVYHVKFSPRQPVLDFIKLVGRDVNSRNISDIELLCSEASLPGSSLATHESTGDYSGVTEKMAYRRIYDESLDLTFYVDNGYNVIEFFDGWMNYITGQGTFRANKDYKRNDIPYRMNYPLDYKGEIFLTKFEKDVSTGFRKMTYTFVDAFPTNIVSSPISYGGSELLKFTVSFSYIRYVRERIYTDITADLQNEFEKSIGRGNPTSGSGTYEDLNRANEKLGLA